MHHTKEHTKEHCWSQIDRLIPVRANVEDIVVKCDLAIVVLMHCHVDLNVALSCVEASTGILALVTCPCCQWIDRHRLCFDRPPDVNYLDYGILSDKRELRVWINQLNNAHQITVPKVANLPECTEVVTAAGAVPPAKTMINSTAKLNPTATTTKRKGSAKGGNDKSIQRLTLRYGLTNSENRDSESIAQILHLRSTITHIPAPSPKSFSVAEASLRLEAAVLQTPCAFYCVAGLNLPLLDGETNEDHNVRQVRHVATEKMKQDQINMEKNNQSGTFGDSTTTKIPLSNFFMTFHGTVVRKRKCSNITFFSILPVGSTKGDGKRSQKQWSESAKEQQQQSVHRDAAAAAAAATSFSSTTISSVKPAVQIAVSEVYIPWDDEKKKKSDFVVKEESSSRETSSLLSSSSSSSSSSSLPSSKKEDSVNKNTKINPGFVWQKCIKMGDHVQVMGTYGRSSSGQLTIFVLDLSIVGRLGRREV